MAAAMLMVTLEMSLSAVALPSIGADLGVGSGAAAWVLLAYALPTAAFAIPVGRWVDGADLRAVFFAAVTCVGVTSVLAAVAPTFWVLIAARVLQGGAGAAVAALYNPVIAATVDSAHRGRALGYMATIMPLGSVAGSSLGGLVAGEFGWRPVFLLKLPVLAAVLWFGRRLIPRTPGGLPRPGRELLGDAVLLGAAAAALLLAIGRLGASAYVLAAGLAVLAVVLTHRWRRLPGAGPVMDLVRAPGFRTPLASMMLIGAFTGLSLFLVPFYVDEVMGRGPGTTGLAAAFFVGSVAVVSPFGGRLADRLPPRLVAAAGAALTTLGAAAALLLGADSGLLDLAWPLAVIGAGQGLFGASVGKLLLAATPASMVGAGGGVIVTARTLSFSVGPALAAGVHGLAGGGLAGFRAAVVVLVGLLVAGTVVAAWRPRAGGSG